MKLIRKADKRLIIFSKFVVYLKQQIFALSDATQLMLIS